MKITLSKTQWQLIGKKTGWIKIAKKLIDVQQDYENECAIYTYEDGSVKKEYFNGGFEWRDAKGNVIERNLGEY